MKVSKKPLSEIVPDPAQPRKHFDPAGIEELANSLKAHGLLQPIRVRLNVALSKWFIVCGHRRVMAAERLGWADIDAIEVETDDDEAETLAQQVTENEARESMTLREMAYAIRNYKALTGANSKDTATKFGCSAVRISRAEDYFSVPESVQRLSDAGAIPDKLVSITARHPDPEAQLALAEAYCQGRMPMDAITAVVQQAAGGKRGRKTPAKHTSITLGNLRLAVRGKEMDAKALLAALDGLRKEVRKAAEKGLSLDDLAQLLSTAGVAETEEVPLSTPSASAEGVCAGGHADAARLEILAGGGAAGPGL